jgi:dTDP-4-dehydrorhamnose reductase
MTTRFERPLLISPDGMLGRAFEQLLGARGVCFDAVRYPELDLRRPETLAAHVRPEHDLVVNCAAYTNVDGAETDEAAATAINGAGVGALGRRAAEVGATVLHFSTDYVFDGRATAPYAIDHPIAPVNAYGRSKAAGEAALSASGARHLIARTSWLYAPWAANFVRTMLKLGAERGDLKVVDDQLGRPTSARYLAERSWELAQADGEGFFHVTDGGQCTWFEFARAIMELSGTPCRVHPCTTDQFPRPARRPAYSVLDLTRTEALIGASRAWRENLAEVIEALRATETTRP